MNIPFPRLGGISAVHATEVAESRIGIGFEKLDRAVFDPRKAYDKVAALGVKWVRIQSGWQRTETEPGVYHFEWLDEIVDQLLARNLKPWICLCYGNGLYDAQAAERFGAVGCPPTRTPEQSAAWLRYVTTCVRHFSGRVEWWELWNEPDCPYSWRYEPDAVGYAAFARVTAAAARRGNPDAKIIGGAFAGSGLTYVSTAFAHGLADCCDAVSFHIYSSDEHDDDERIVNLRAMIRRYKPELKLVQGEGGCQSRPDGCGALSSQAWTEEKQAKSLARHMIAQLGYDVMFSSYFSCMDMIEALNGKVGDKASYLDFGYFGVLGADFDKNGVSTGEYTPKPSYRTLQVIAALFQGTFTVEKIPAESVAGCDLKFGGSYRTEALSDCCCHGFRRANDAAAFAYWKQSNLLRETFEGSVSFRLAEVPATEPRLVDVMDGSIYELPKDRYEIQQSGKSARIEFKNLPLYDRPLMLLFGDFTPATAAPVPKHRFTLIELLIVVAIIAILAGMLLPALNRARQNARAIDCVNNLRQLSVVFTEYTDANRGFLLARSASTPQWSPHYFVKEPKFVSCPSGLRPTDWTVNRKAYTYGIRYGSWGSDYEAQFGTPFTQDCFFMPRLRHTSRYIILGDSVRYGTTAPGAPGYQYNASASIGMHYLHSFQANLLFADGHAGAHAFLRVRALVSGAWSHAGKAEFHRMPDYRQNYPL